uniref:Uncharacterized protein n=1 Tax=Rhizophora mucronata TaxID=61149 RepID=A0A2P2NGN7_RHIMU
MYLSIVRLHIVLSYNLKSKLH